MVTLLLLSTSTAINQNFKRKNCTLLKSIITTIAASSMLFTGSSSLLGGNEGSSLNGNSVTISQGDKWYIGDSYRFCTISYVTDEYAFTSGHCAEAGQDVYDVNRNLLGTIIEKSNVNPYFSPEDDWAVIELDDDVKPQGNNYSGDKIIELQDVEIGDEICRYGAKTQEVLCADVVANENPKLVRNNNVVLSNSGKTRDGDSGGAVWIPGKGYIGLHMGTSSVREGIEIATPIMGKIPEKYYL